MNGEKQRFTRKEAARYISAHYFPIAPQTLAKLACARPPAGPSFVRCGWRTVIYVRDKLDEWAKSRMVEVEVDRAPKARFRVTAMVSGQ